MLLAVALASAIVPWGALALSWAGYRRSGWPWAAAMIACSLAVWPVLLLWLSAVGLRWTATGLRVAAVVGWLLLLAIVGRQVAGAIVRPRPSTRTRPALPRLVDAIGSPLLVGGLALFALALVFRVVDARGLVAAPWVDGLHHTLIAQLIVDAGRVPAGFRPYLEVDGFFYHFGFHATAAAVAGLAGADARLPVLALGQLLAALTALTQAALGYRLTGHRLAALAGAAVPAAWYWFPAYFVSWGRYTQLAGLVMLPGAWLLLSDALAPERRWRHPRRAVALAVVASAGLALTHYRVSVFFAAGALAMVAAPHVGGTRDKRIGVRRSVNRLAVISLGAAAVISPWLLGALLPGVLRLGASSASWYAGPNPEAVADLPAWLFTTYLNRPLIALAAAGLALALVRRRRSAVAVAAVTLLLIVIANPGWLGLPQTWFMPPFALAISAFVPVGLGVSFLAREVLRPLGSARSPRSLPRPMVLRSGAQGSRRRSRRWEWAGTAGVISLAAWLGAGRPTVVNPYTVLLTEADIRAAAWIRDHTPPDSRFLVGTTGWNLGAFRGLDGGYWLPLTAGRQASIPPALYFYGPVDYAARVAELGRLVAQGDLMTDADIRRALDLAGADYVYVGPASAGDASKLNATRLDRAAFLSRVYGEDGVVIWRCTRC